MKKALYILIVIVVLTSCHKDTDGIEINEQNYLVFGHFYGLCFGEECVETFKLTDKKLFEDTIDDYNGQNFEFIELGNDKFEQVNDLVDFFPDQLLNDNNDILGCPDCADGGGLFIQNSKCMR